MGPSYGISEFMGQNFCVTLPPLTKLAQLESLIYLYLFPHVLDSGSCAHDTVSAIT
jgi:hypothetical protein